MDARGWRAWSLARTPRARRRAATSAPHACAWRARHCGTRATPVPCPALRSGETWRGAAARAHGRAGAVQKPEGRAGSEHAGTAATAGRGRASGLPRSARAICAWGHGAAAGRGMARQTPATPRSPAGHWASAAQGPPAPASCPYGVPRAGPVPHTLQAKNSARLAKIRRSGTIHGPAWPAPWGRTT